MTDKVPEMVERVARAIGLADLAESDPARMDNVWATGGKSSPLWHVYIGPAISAIEAMRSPTLEMNLVGVAIDLHYDFDERDGRSVGWAAVDVWSAMIKTALKK